MNAFLAFLEKALIVIFVVAFGTLAIFALVRYNSGRFEEGDPWRHVKRQNTIEAYLGYLRECQSCARQDEAENALDQAQRSHGLVTRLSTAHLPERASITDPVFAPEGQTVLAAGGGRPEFWNVDDGRHLTHMDQSFAVRSGRPVETLDYRPDGKLIAAGIGGGEGGHLLVWNEREGVLVADQFIEGYDVQFVEFSPQGDALGWLAQGPVGIWEPATGKFLRATHEGAGAMAFFRENNRLWLLTASGKDVWFWDPTTMELGRQIHFNTDRYLLGLSRDGRLAAYSEGQTLELWDVRTEFLVATLADHDGDVLSFCREPKKGWLVVGTKTGTLYLWNPTSATLLARVPAHEGPVEQVACSAEGQAVSISWDSAKVWNLEKMSKSPSSPPKK
ncbi:WD40 repeat domain-containing protein [Methylomagnum sp.]